MPSESTRASQSIRDRRRGNRRGSISPSYKSSARGYRRARFLLPSPLAGEGPGVRGAAIPLTPNPSPAEGEGNNASHKIIPCLMPFPVHMRPIVQPRSLECLVIHPKTEPANKVQHAARRRTESSHIAGVGWDFGFVKSDVEHGKLSRLFGSSRRCGQRPAVRDASSSVCGVFRQGLRRESKELYFDEQQLIMPPTPIVKKTAVRPRLDAVALIAAVAGFLLLAAIATSQSLSGRPSPIGNAGEMTASPAVHSLGFASHHRHRRLAGPDLTLHSPQILVDVSHSRIRLGHSDGRNRCHGRLCFSDCGRAIRCWRLHRRVPSLRPR